MSSFQIRSRYPARDAAAVRSRLSDHPGITLEEMFSQTEGLASRDDWYQMIASGDVYVDLHAVSLTDHQQVRVFPDRETALAHRHLLQTSPPPRHSTPRFVSLAVGQTFQWDGQSWTIVNVGETMIGLLGSDHSFTELPVAAFEKLLGEGRISGVADDSASPVDPKVKARFAAADQADYAVANRRSEWVRAYLCGALSPKEFPVPARTFYRWVSQYRQAQETLGSGYLGLLPQPNRGNERDKLPTATRALLNEFIKQDYGTIKQKKCLRSTPPSIISPTSAVTTIKH